jgi:hypothetical protein
MEVLFLRLVQSPPRGQPLSPALAEAHAQMKPALINKQSRRQQARCQQSRPPRKPCL